ncbi:MAG TPA: GNAT family N-acetyltransferase [Mycobacteriales bacterium]|nr:GNAT family N-acetyltransferase [Mycobacteriales bacterium]
MSEPGGSAAVETRCAVPADLPALTAIYNHYIVHTAATFDIEPFEVAAREAWFSHYSTTGPYRLFVAVQDGEVVGYASSSRFRPKPAYDTSVEVTVYLHPRVTASGIGTALYRRLFGELRSEPLHRAYAVIALPNSASVALHTKFGFAEAGTLTQAGRKFDKWWDVLHMECAIN